MKKDDESLYRNGLVVRARLSGQEAIHAPAPKRVAQEKPAPVKRSRVAPPPPDDMVEVFVTRVSSQAFSWQVRRFGAIVVQEGPQTYPNAQLARQAGEAALGSL